MQPCDMRHIVLSYAVIAGHLLTNDRFLPQTLHDDYPLKCFADNLFRFSWHTTHSGLQIITVEIFSLITFQATICVTLL